MKKLVPLLILVALILQTVSFALPLFAQDEQEKNPESYLTDDEKAWVAQARANLENMKNNLTYHRVIIRNYNTQDWAEWRWAYYRSWQTFYPEGGWEGPGGTSWWPPSFNNLGYQVNKAYVSNALFSSWEAQYEQFSKAGVQPSSATQLQWLAQEEAALQGLPEKIATDEALLNTRIATIAAQRQKEQEQQKQQEEQETNVKASKFQEIINRALEIRDMLVERILMFLINKRSSKSTDTDNQTNQVGAVTQGTSIGTVSTNELDETDIKDLRYCRIMYKLHAGWASGSQSDPYAGHEEWAYVDGRFKGLVYTGERVYTYPNSTLPIKMKYEVTLHRDQSGKIQSADFKYYYETTDSIQTPPRGPDVLTNINAMNVPRKQDKEEKWTQYFEVTGDQVMSCLDTASTLRTAAFNPKGACCWVTKWSANRDSFIRIELSPSIPKSR